MMTLLLLLVFFGGLFFSRYGAPTLAMLCLIAGVLVCILGSMQDQAFVQGRPWAVEEYFGADDMWNLGFSLIAGSVIGLVIRTYRFFNSR